MQTPGEGELLIHARSRHEAEVALAPGDTLHWALKVANQRLNVSVALLLTSEDGSLERSETLHDGSLRREDGVVGGVHTNDTEAHVGQPAKQRVVFTLDNTFSRSTSKALAYRVWITTAQEELHNRQTNADLYEVADASSPPPPPPVELEIGLHPRVDAAEADWSVLSARLREDGWSAPGPEYDGKGAALLVGHRIFVRGRGEGRVLEYTYHKMRASSHQVLFDGTVESVAETVYLESSAEGNRTSDGGYLPYLVDLNGVIRVRAEEWKATLPAAADAVGTETGEDIPHLPPKQYVGPPWQAEDASSWCRLRDVRGEHMHAHSRTPHHLPPPPRKSPQAGDAKGATAATEDGSKMTGANADSGLAGGGRERRWTGFGDGGQPGDCGGHQLYDTFVMLGVGNSVQEQLGERDQNFPGPLDCEPELLMVYPPCDDEGRRESLRMFCCPDNFEVRSAAELHGQIPQCPDYEQYIFRMTEGLAAPVPLFGACVKTVEKITIEPRTCAVLSDVRETSLGVDPTTAATSAAEQSEESASGPVTNDTSSVADRRRRLGGRLRQRDATTQRTQEDSDGMDSSSSATVYLAPRCYCLLSRTPHFDLLFATLYGLLRTERLHSVTDQVVLDVEVPAGQHMATGHSHWVEVVHGEGVFTALLPGLQHCMEDQVPEGATGIRKRTIVSGQHFQLAVPSSWRSRKLSGMEYDVGEEIRESLYRARQLQVGAIGSTFNIPASVFGVSCGGNVWGPDKIPDRPTAYSLWALGTALEHCSVEVLLAAATGMLLERPLIVLHRSKSARSAVVFALLALLGPWRYPHTCLPLVPPMMYELATAPVPFLLGMPSEDDLSPFEQDARAASVLCAMTGVLREGTPPGCLDTEAEVGQLQLSESELKPGAEPESEEDTGADGPYTPRETVYVKRELPVAADEDDGTMMTLSQLEFGQALLGKGGVASLSSQLRPKAAALWQARRYTHSALSVQYHSHQNPSAILVVDLTKLSHYRILVGSGESMGGAHRSATNDAESRAVQSFMETVFDFHTELGEAIAAGECEDAGIQHEPFVQQFKLSSIWEQHSN